MSDLKSPLRNHFRRLRRELPSPYQRSAASALSLRLLRHPWLRTSQHIAFYWPADGEISPLNVLLHALKLGKICYLPHIHGNRHMSFHRYQLGDHLQLNRFHIKEPLTWRPSRDLNQMDTVLLPLVAFDHQGNRLGMGGGFYDRNLQFCGRRPRKIGLAYECQGVGHLPKDSWDISLHGVCTERRFAFFTKR